MMDTMRRFVVGPTPQEQVRSWQHSIRKEVRSLDRQINSISTADSKTKSQIRSLAKRGDTASCKFLAKEILRARKSRNRLEASKATLGSLSMQLGEQLATIKITGALQKSAVIMREVNSLVKLPELTTTMGRLQGEMMKAGIMDEMVSDTLNLGDTEDLDIEADEEVNKILSEITGEQFQMAGQVPTTIAGQATAEQDEEEEANLEEMRSRLAALKE